MATDRRADYETDRQTELTLIMVAAALAALLAFGHLAPPPTYPTDWTYEGRVEADATGETFFMSRETLPGAWEHRPATRDELIRLSEGTADDVRFLRAHH